jgi:hypothetical protein
VAGANWVRLDSGYFRNPKVRAAGRDAMVLHLAAICWCGDQSTNGHVPAAAVSMVLYDAGSKRSAVDDAVSAGLWVPNGDGFVLHDFDVMNGWQSAAQLQRDRQRERQRRWRESKRPDDA